MELLCKALQDRSYKIYVEWDLLKNLQSILDANSLSGPFFIITDRNVFAAHGEKLLQALSPAPAFVLKVKPGETAKSLANWKRAQNFFLKNGADRKSVVIAFGGGVIGDLAGFAASTYMRGLDFIQMPTTILSQSDSSIGAKVAINHPSAKNLIGSYYQPKLILTDPSLTATLPPRELSAGLGEAIKYGVIADPELFETLYRHVEELLAYNRQFLMDLIVRCIKIKIRVVEEDERETGLRKILNFGHTIGHALEQATHYRRLRHGEAVAWGMLAAGWIAVNKGMWESGEFAKLQSIIERAKCLYPLGNLKTENILEALKHDKKKAGKRIHFVLPEKTGQVRIVSDVSDTMIREAIEFMLGIAPSAGERTIT